MDAYHLAMASVQGGGGLNQVPELLTRLPLIGHFSQDLMDRFILAYGNVQDSILEGGKAVGGIGLSSVGGLAKNTIDLVVDFLVVLFTLFFLFRDGHHLYEVFYEALPIKSSDKTVIFERLDNVVVTVGRGTLLTGRRLENEGQSHFSRNRPS